MDDSSIRLFSFYIYCSYFAAEDENSLTEWNECGCRFPFEWLHCNRLSRIVLIHHFGNDKKNVNEKCCAYEMNVSIMSVDSIPNSRMWLIAFGAVVCYDVRWMHSCENYDSQLNVLRYLLTEKSQRNQSAKNSMHTHSNGWLLNAHSSMVDMFHRQPLGPRHWDRNYAEFETHMEHCARRCEKLFHARIWVYELHQVSAFILSISFMGHETMKCSRSFSLFRSKHALRWYRWLLPHTRIRIYKLSTNEARLLYRMSMRITRF